MNIHLLSQGTAHSRAEEPVLTVGSYRPFSTTLWDYTCRGLRIGCSTTELLCGGDPASIKTTMSKRDDSHGAPWPQGLRRGCMRTLLRVKDGIE